MHNKAALFTALIRITHCHQCDKGNHSNHKKPSRRKTRKDSCPSTPNKYANRTDRPDHDFQFYNFLVSLLGSSVDFFFVIIFHSNSLGPLFFYEDFLECNWINKEFSSTIRAECYQIIQVEMNIGTAILTLHVMHILVLHP